MGFILLPEPNKDGDQMNRGFQHTGLQRLGGVGGGGREQGCQEIRKQGFGFITAQLTLSHKRGSSFVCQEIP